MNVNENQNENFMFKSNTPRKFIETYSGNARLVYTPDGYRTIIEVHKTIKYRKVQIYLDNGLKLECAYNHVVINANNKEVFAEDCTDEILQTVHGDSRVTSVVDTGIEEHMYDISIDSETELYYSNGVLSHNSGKSVTVGIKLSHYFVFSKDMNIGIAANKAGMAREFLDKTKNILILLPIWLQQGVKVWNKTFIESENGMRIMTDATSQDSFRGFTCLRGDTKVKVFDKITNEKKTLSLTEINEDITISNVSNNYKIETPTGYQDFAGLKETIQTGLVITLSSGEVINCTKSHRILVSNKPKIFRQAKKLKVTDSLLNSKIVKIEQDKEQTYYDPVQVQGDNTYLANGEVHHNCNIIIVDECVEYDTTVTIKDEVTQEVKDIKIGDLYKTSSYDKLLIKTADGFKSFSSVKETIKDPDKEHNLKFYFDDGTDITVTEEHLFYAGKSNKRIYRKAKNIKVNHKVQGVSNGPEAYKTVKRVIKIEKDVSCSNKFYDAINVEGGHHYLTNNVTSHNCAFIRTSVWNEFADGIFPSQSGLAFKKTILISTANGKNHFYDIIKGAREDSNGFKNFEVPWQSIPRYNQDGTKKEPTEFQHEIIQKYGNVYFEQNYGCIDYDSIIIVQDKEETTFKVKIGEFEEFYDTFNHRYKIKSTKGFEEFDGIVKRKSRTLKITTEDGNSIIVSENHKFIVKIKNSGTIIAKKLKVNDYIQNSTSTKITEIEKLPEQVVYDVLNTESSSYIANGYLNHNCDFHGSSHTLISSSALELLKAKEPEELRDGMLNVYYRPEKGHKYIFTVDPAKDGQDAFSVNIVDITDFKFKQVASAKIQVDYLIMPEYIDEWARYYNEAYLIIENNEGAGQSVTDQMVLTFEYENIHYDVIRNKMKKYSGTRTTTKSRKQILQTMKTFIENGKLQINDKSTIEELNTFILTKGKYQAQDGSHDDTIMSLALTFVIFNDLNNFEDMKDVVKKIQSNETEEFADEVLNIGSFDDGIEENSSYTNASYTNSTSFELEYSDMENNIGFM